MPILFLIVFVDLVGFGLVIPLLPFYAERFHATPLEMTALFATYSLMAMVMAPLWGRLSDRIGRRPVLMASMRAAALAYCWLAFADALWMVFAARAFAGACAGNIAAAQAYIADVTPPEKRAASFGLIGIAFGLGFIIGPVLGGHLGEIGLRVPFYVAAGLCAANFALAYFRLPESLRPEDRRPFRLRDANPVGAFIIISRYAAVVALISVFAFTQLAERAMESTWVLFTGFRFGWGPADVGWSLALVGLLIVFSEGFLVRVLVKRWGEARMLTYGLVVGGLAMVVLMFASVPWMAILAISIYVLGWGVVGPAARAMASRTVGRDQQGILQGAISSVTTATGIIAPPIAAGLFGFFVGPSAPFIFPGVPFLLGAALFAVSLLIARQRRIRGAIESAAV
jgi:DHA1 family tetracycline resistance protein-like MFS transporter